MSANLGCFARRAAWSAAAGSAWWTQRAVARADSWAPEAPVTERLAPAVAAARLARQARDRRFDGYVEPEALAKWLAAGRTGLAVVDVRDSDFRAARTGRLKIRGAWHAPACELRSDAAPLVEALRGADTVVFHCMFSQQRGPACAQRTRSTGARSRRRFRHNTCWCCATGSQAFRSAPAGARTPRNSSKGWDPGTAPAA